jgi:hypothetical protein
MRKYPVYLAAAFAVLAIAEAGLPPQPGRAIIANDVEIQGDAEIQGWLITGTTFVHGDLVADGEVEFGDSLYIRQKLMLGRTSPHPSAMFQIDSTTGGVLFPRMTQAQRQAIPSPANGLVVYQTNGTSGLYLRDAGVWKRVMAQ